jgi:deazaflavin-dependent oxidoreductase (nitroreductase family)
MFAQHDSVAGTNAGPMRAYVGFWRWIGHKRWFAVAMRYALSKVDREIYRISGGRLALTGPPVLPILLLTTTGRKTGRKRTVPLTYLRDEAKLVLTSENFGLERKAGWPRNLLANPEATVRIGRQAARYRSRPAGEEEITRYWPRLLEVWPALQTYMERSGERFVFVLEPVASGVEKNSVA